MELYQSRSADPDVKLRAELNGLDHLWVLGDSQKVVQVLTNLLRNAIKFTDHGEIEITLLADSASQSTPSYRIKVRDTGIGMSQTQLGSIFDAFVQVDNSDRRKYLGTGLGLSICRQLTHLMGGELTVQSTPKFGSEFTLSLPMQVVVEPQSDPGHTSTSGFDAQGRRILVAEDSKPNQLVFRSMLERRGYEVDVANDGIEACAAMNKKGQGSTGYGLILMDVQMPGMDGIEATRWIRNNGYSLPIIALTAKAFMEDEKACLEAGMNDFMTKPVNYDALLSRVDMWLGDESAQTSTLPGEKISEMRVLMGEEAFREALGVFTQEVIERHAMLHNALANVDFAKASSELHTLFGIYAGYGFEELQHLSRALKDSCDAQLTPPAKSLQQFDELSSELLQKIENYRAETA